MTPGEAGEERRGEDVGGDADLDRSLWQKYLRERYRRIARLNTAWGTNWARFEDMPLPDHVPQTTSGIRDWLIFEGQVLPMDRAAHRFTVLLPRLNVDFDRDQASRPRQQMLGQRSPARSDLDDHTVGDAFQCLHVLRRADAEPDAERQVGVEAEAEVARASSLPAPRRDLWHHKHRASAFRPRW